MKKLVFIFFVLVIIGCESEKQKIEKSINSVQRLKSNLSLSNLKGAFEVYPNLKKVNGSVDIGSLNTMKITSTNIREDNIVELYAQSNNRNYVFKTKKIDGNWIVFESLGLSSFLNTNIHNYIKRIGCQSSNDIDLANNVIRNKSDFNLIVSKIKKIIEQNIIIENQSLSNPLGRYGNMISGDVTLKNYSIFNLPSYSYELFYILRNGNRDVIKQKVSYPPGIQSGGTYTFMVQNGVRANQIVIDLNIIDESFIEKGVGLAAKGNGCVYSNNLTGSVDVSPPVDLPPSNLWSKSGSGIFISNEGYIITNHHVIENANEIVIEFMYEGEKKSYNALVYNYDEKSDLAILKIDDASYQKIEELNYSINKNSNSLLGEDVFTLGFPITEIMGSDIKYTNGSISSINGFKGDKNTYQISAPIQPGNSGGPLFNYDGELIGINVAILDKKIASNVGYSIKSGVVVDFINSSAKKIKLPLQNKLIDLSLTEKIKKLQNYTVFIKVK